MRRTLSVRLLIATMLLIGCTTMDSDRAGQGLLPDPLTVLARNIATSKGDQRYAVATRMYCGHSETCPPGEGLWGATTLHALLETLNATPAPAETRAPLAAGRVDMVLSFGPFEQVGTDSGRIIVRYEYHGGVRIDRAHLERRSSTWHVGRIETIVIATVADTVIKVR
jgi:hypothetical protein